MLNLDKTDLKNDTLIITNDDGSISCISREDANESELAMFAEFEEAFPYGKPVPEAEVSLDDAKATKTIEIKDAYNQAVFGGFTSSASGTSIEFGYAESDQTKFMKLLMVMNAGLITYPTTVYAKDSTAITLTQEQLTQLFRDLTAFEMGLEDKLHTYIAEINSATTADEVAAIAWE